MFLAAAFIFPRVFHPGELLEVALDPAVPGKHRTGDVPLWQQAFFNKSCTRAGAPRREELDQVRSLRGEAQLLRTRQEGVREGRGVLRGGAHGRAPVRGFCQVRGEPERSKTFLIMRLCRAKASP